MAIFAITSGWTVVIRLLFCSDHQLNLDHGIAWFCGRWGSPAARTCRPCWFCFGSFGGIILFKFFGTLNCMLGYVLVRPFFIVDIKSKSLVVIVCHIKFFSKNQQFKMLCLFGFRIQCHIKKDLIWKKIFLGNGKKDIIILRG